MNSEQLGDQSQQEMLVEMSQAENAGLLIELIQHYEFLFNLGHSDYKNATKKEQAWREIAGILNLNVEECQKLWRWVRDRYTREKRDQGRSGSGAPESRWALFDKMAFYNKYTRPRKTYTATPPVSKRPADIAIAGPSKRSSPWSTMDIIVPPSSGSLSADDNSNDGSPSTNTETRQTPKTVRRVSTKRTVSQSDEDNNFLAMAKQLTEVVKNRTPVNQNRTFSEHIYTILEDMPAEEAKEKRKQILLILYS